LFAGAFAVASDKAVSVACRRPSSFSLLAHATAGAVANGEAGPKGGGQDARSQEKEPREMAWFDTPGLRAGCVEDFGSTHGDATCDAATPRRIWKLRHSIKPYPHTLVIPA
jgi:poly(3-hydroxybutyrate) depolymerase